MKNKRYFGLTNFSSCLAIFIGFFILIVGIVSMVMYYTNGSWNLVSTYFKNTGMSKTPALVLTIVELASSILFILLGLITLKQRKLIMALNCFVFTFFCLYYLVVFFVFLGINYFDYFSIQTFAYPAYFVILAFIAIGYWLEISKVEIKAISHRNKSQVQEKPIKIVIERPKNATVPSVTDKVNTVDPGLKFNFIEPTLNNKTEAEKIQIKKTWEQTAAKLNALKYNELKKIAEDKGIEVSGKVKKIRLVDLLKKVVKIYVKRKNITKESEINFNEKKLWMFTLAELKNITQNEKIDIFSGANKIDYINVLKDKIHVSIEFTV